MESVTARLPQYNLVEQNPNKEGTTYWVVGSNTDSVPEALRSTFEKDGEVTHNEGSSKTVYLTLKKAKTTSISSDVFVKIDADLGDTEHSHYLGDVSDFLSSAYKFTRKSNPKSPNVVSIDKSSPKIHRAINLAESKNRAREWANGRGDEHGVPNFFKKQA